MDITPYLQLMVEKQASDLFFYADAAAHIKIDGQIRPIGQQKLNGHQVHRMVFSLMNDQQMCQFEERMELNFALPVTHIGRFRANAFRQRGEVALVIRYIKDRIPDTDELNLPTLLNRLVLEKRGLIIIAGATGCGKSTTLAAMIDYRNRNCAGHILTIEDPIEYNHPHKRCIVGQRELNIDTHSYENALKSAMREAPDVILVGEVRSRDVMHYALSYAETGHLCLTTLHASNTYGAIERITNFFREESRQQLCNDLAANLKAIVCQRLVPNQKGQLIPTVEILLNTPFVADLISKGKLNEIKQAMESGNDLGMRSFDQDLFQLYQQGKISENQAISYADSRNNVSLQIRLNRMPEDQVGKNLNLKSDNKAH